MVHDCSGLRHIDVPDPAKSVSETRVALVTAIARGRHWLDELITGAATDVMQIATRAKCSVRQINLTISLAFLSTHAYKGCCRRSAAAGHWYRSPA